MEIKNNKMLNNIIYVQRAGFFVPLIFNSISVIAEYLNTSAK